MQERFNWHAWKACVPQKGTGGSNPPLSAPALQAGPLQGSPAFIFMLTTSKLACEEKSIKIKSMHLRCIPAVPEQVLPLGIMSAANNPRRRRRGLLSRAKRVIPPLSAPALQAGPPQGSQAFIFMLTTSKLVCEEKSIKIKSMHLRCIPAVPEQVLHQGSPQVIPVIYIILIANFTSDT